MLGVSLGRPADPISLGLIGWLITLTLWVIFGVRSVRYECKTLPRSTATARTNRVAASFLQWKVLWVIALVTVLSALLALVILGLLVMQAAHITLR